MNRERAAGNLHAVLKGHTTGHHAKGLTNNTLYVRLWDGILHKNSHSTWSALQELLRKVLLARFMTHKSPLHRVSQCSWEKDSTEICNGAHGNHVMTGDMGNAEKCPGLDIHGTRMNGFCLTRTVTKLTVQINDKT